MPIPGGLAEGAAELVRGAAWLAQSAALAAGATAAWAPGGDAPPPALSLMADAASAALAL